MNRVVTAFSAVVGGKPTGLAGCLSSKDCERAAHCLRAEPLLQYRVAYGGESNCGAFILNPKDPA